MRLICSTRDVGAYKQLEAFLEFCLKKNFLNDYLILAQDPALSYSKLNKKKIIKISKRNLKIKYIENIFQEFSPNFTIAGLSAFNIGIDEVLIKVSKKNNVPVGVIQDYWGYLGRVRNLDFPDYFFVIDSLAKKLTKSRLPKNQNSKIIVTGSPKHSLYREKIKSWNIKKKIKKKSVHIFMQPLNIPGIIKNYLEVLYVLKEFAGDIRVFIHKHPSDKTNKAYNLVKNLNMKYTTSNKNALEKNLMNADLVLTFFSTIGLDHNYLQAFKDKQIGELIYVNIGCKIKNYMHEVIGQTKVPGSSKKLGKTVVNKKQLIFNMKKFIKGEKLNTYSIKSIKKFAKNISPSNRIISIIKKYK